MKSLADVVEEQRAFIATIRDKTRTFIDQIDKKEIQTILLSGSVARGDYCPGEYGGMVDLTVMRKDGSAITPEAAFGPDEEPDIPYHCVTRNGIGYQIAFSGFVDCGAFRDFDESKKYALLESEILFDRDRAFGEALREIGAFAAVDRQSETQRCIGYVRYLLSDYKKDRWYRREAFPQMHDNLNAAVRQIIKCLFYVNGKYAPAEDRRLYYSFDLDRLPNGYGKIIAEISEQRIDSKEDYRRRETLFNETLLAFVTKNAR